MAATIVDRRLRWALLILTVVKGWTWIGVTPIWKVVDEPAHFDNVQYRVEHGQAPRWDGRPLQPVMNPGASRELHESWQASQRYWRGRYLSKTRVVPEEAELRRLSRAPEARRDDGQMLEMSYPGFYYSLAGLPYRLFWHSSIVTRGFALRFLSLLFGLLAVLCSYAAARYVIDDPWLAFAVGVFVALQPMASQQTASVNNDAAAIGVGALVFYLQLRVLARWPASPSWVEHAVLGLASGLGLWCKPHMVALVPATAAVMLVACWPARRERRGWMAAGAGLLGFALLAGPAVPVLIETARVLDAVNVMTRPPAPLVHDSFPVWFWRASELRDNMFGFYWGRFGWTEFTLDRQWVDWLHLVLWFVLGGGLFALFARVAAVESTWWRRRGLALSAAVVVLVHAFVWYMEYRAETRLHVKWVLQGRHFLIALPALATLTVMALAAPLPARLRPLAAAIIVTGAALLNLGSLATIARYHYGN